MLGKFMLAAGLLVAMGYVGICALLYFKQRDLVYFPAATVVSADATDFRLAHDGITLRGWKLNPGRPRALIYFGGNAERLEPSRETFAQLFPDRTIYLLPYRGYGASEGQPTETALFADALSLYDAVKTAHPGQPVAVIGRSLGSGVASYLASRRPVEKLVLVTPFDSLAEVAQAHYRWLPVHWLVQDRYTSTQYLARYQGPLLVLRAGRDEVIPPANTDRLIASMARPPIVMDFPRADHNSIAADPGYERALGDFLR